MAGGYEAVIKLLAEAVRDELNIEKAQSSEKIPVGVSNRHAHLSRKDKSVLFGEGYDCSNMKDLSQPEQFAANETVTVCGPRGVIQKVRVLGPVRKDTQIELLKSDCIKLGIAAKVRSSGDIADTPGLTIVGPKGSLQITQGAIVAKRHIHMTPEDAKRFNVKDQEIVDVKVEGERGGILSNVVIRATEMSQLELHVDTEEANAMGLDSSSMVTIIKK